MKFLATIAFGLEGVLKNELILLGMDVKSTNMGSVVYEGKIDSLVWANSCLRTPDRIYWVLDEFEALSFDELFENILNYPFEDIMPSNAKIIVNAKSYKSKVYSLRDIQKISKKAIVKRFSNKKGIKYMDETGEEYPILVKIEKNHVYLLLDTTGIPLHKRGYRRDSRLAPIRENFAAGLILLSRWFGKGVFIDPMCGSGTIAIEAALIGKNIPPGINRKFLFEKWGILSKKDVDKNRQSIKSGIKNDISLEIRASDIDKTAIKYAKNNAKNAGVSKDIVFANRDISDLKTEFTGGTVVTNMPYGKRLGTEEELKNLEKMVDEKILTLETYRLGILSANDRFSQHKKRKVSKVRKFYNARIETFFYQYEPTKRW
ncbi:MAG: RNA methyltransferase [Clostridiales bacterium]|nr:MAG: RNA methyltransferase [Clostridiales bacterium]